MKEEAFRYGENNLGFGMVSLPSDVSNAPIVVALNAGLTSREGPHRLNVLAGRALAQAGYIAIRLDLAGKGDSPAREGMTNRDSVALDWKFIKHSISRSYGARRIIIMGLCSGADNAIKLGADDPDVHGMILLDAISPKDADFHKRQLHNKVTNVHKWIGLPRTLLRRIRQLLGLERDAYEEMESLRDQPTAEDLDRCFRHMAACQGRVLAVFTSQATPHYNQQGQFAKALSIAGIGRCIDEIYWPLAQHLYPVQAHRDRLLGHIAEWGKANLAHFQRGRLE